MMSAQRDWYRRFSALTYRAISADTAAPCLAAIADSLFLALRDLTGILLGFLRGRATFWLCTGRRLCRANLVRSLRVHFAGCVTLGG